MSELKPCPFCGGTKICTEKGINLNYCDSCSAEANIEHWNTRPIEDALNKRIAESEEAFMKLEDTLDDVEFERAVGIGRLNERIAELEAERRWIPVSERLPKAEQDVLVFDTRGDITIDFLVAFNRDGVAYYTNSDDGAVCWMPLPELPKECEE